MKQGTISVLFGCHSLFHAFLVFISWIKLYHRFPKVWELVCIAIHDLGHWNTQYLDNFEEKRTHWVPGAKLGRKFFGQKAYELIRGHCTYDGQPKSLLRRPDKYSWLIAPYWWMWTNTLFEPKLIRPGMSRLQSVKYFKGAMKENWDKGLIKEGHDIYLEQWQSRRLSERN